MQAWPPPYLPEELSAATNRQIKAAVLYIIFNHLTDDSIFVCGHSVGDLLREHNRIGMSQRPIRIRETT
jgi:hypothetical protein